MFAHVQITPTSLLLSLVLRDKDPNLLHLHHNAEAITDPVS